MGPRGRSVKVEISVPDEFQGTVMGGVNKRQGVILDSETMEGFCTLLAEVPLNNMFGYASELRSSTQGKGEFTMEFNKYSAVLAGEQAEIIKAYQQSLKDKKK